MHQYLIKKFNTRENIKKADVKKAFYAEGIPHVRGKTGCRH